MPKFIKGNAGRKPPEPAANHDDIDALLEGQMPTIQPLAKAVDELICATIPDLQFVVKRAHAYYGLPDLGWIIEVAAYHVSVNVLFLGGADFEVPPPLGNVDRTRYIKLTDLDEVPSLRGWITEAGRTPGWQ